MMYQVSDITDRIFSYGFNFLAQLRPIAESPSFMRAVRPVTIMKCMICVIKADLYDLKKKTNKPKPKQPLSLVFLKS